MLRSWGAEPRKRQTPYTRLRPGRSHRALSPWGEPSLTFFAKRNTSRPESGDTRGGQRDEGLRLDGWLWGEAPGTGLVAEGP